MGTSRWHRVDRIVQDAIARDEAGRQTYLDEACAGDADLRREVESLLACDVPAGDFLDTPAFEHLARSIGEDSDASLSGRDLGGYRIEALIGAGGMGEVYRAQDLRLQRDVALKVFRRTDGAPGDFQRFEDEARVASGLTHPNIVTIYSVGAEGDVGYIAMELVQGRTLREILDGGALPIESALDLAAQLADAMAAAHRAGIVHRDLKPDNVMLTSDGLLKVLDFGIARRSGGTSAGDAATGTIVGTANYMSPEQAEGRPVGVWSDQFSFGVMLYELLSGTRPFERGTRVETLAAIVDDAVPPVAALDGGRAAPIRKLLRTCLAKQPETRYATTQALAAELRSIREDWQRPGAGLSRRQVLWLGAAGAAAIATGATSSWWWPAPGGVRSLAVLPFVNTAHDEDAEHLCAGLTSALIDRLASLPSLSVMSHSLVLNFKDRQLDPREAGRQLGVEAVLVGTLARRSGLLLVQAELVEVASGRLLWSASYDRESGDLLAIEDEIVRAIVDEAIRLRIGQDDRSRLVRNPTRDAAAYDHYLRAIRLVAQDNEDAYLEARALLDRAISRDPRFVEAYIARAATFAAMAVDGLERPTDAWPQSSLNIRRALDLDPGAPDAHASAAAFEFFFNWHWGAAEREWQLAMRSGPSRVHPDLMTARALQRWALGHADDALRLVRLARRADHLSPMYAVREADYLFHMGRLDAAAGFYEHVVQTMPRDVRAYVGLAEVRRRQGRFDEALGWRRRALDTAGDASLDALFATARGAEGYRRIEQAAAQRQLEALEARRESGRYVSPLDFARTLAQLDEFDSAFSFFEAAFADRAPGLVFLEVDRVWDPVRHDQRFLAARRRVGLP